MNNLKFNFLSRGQPESLSLDKFFLNCIENITMPSGFLVT